jgi:hypothetical protein
MCNCCAAQTLTARTRAPKRVLGGLVQIMNRHLDLLPAADVNAATMLQVGDRLVVRSGFMRAGIIDEHERLIVDLGSERFESQEELAKRGGFGELELTQARAVMNLNKECEGRH